MRQQILEAAKANLGRGGYEHLNFGVIAKSLDTTRANIHYHFKNKEGLALEATRNFIESELAAMKKNMAKHPGDFPAAMEEFERVHWRSIRKADFEGGLVCDHLLLEPDLPDDLGILVADFFDQVYQTLLKHVRESQKAGTLRQDISAQQFTAKTLAMAHGMKHMAFVSRDLKKYQKRYKGALTHWVRSCQP
ncbi:MAG: TetR/AcrR family transcriptional regulator [Verrucomicrobiota bacterium]